jgi:hypothetical protein
MTKPSKPRPADFNVSNAVHEMQSSHLQCRDFGHSWRPYTATWIATERYYEVQLRCNRCKTIRIRDIGQTGALVGSKYEYAEGYLIKGMGRLDGNERDMMRLESVMRILPDDAAEDAG